MKLIYDIPASFWGLFRSVNRDIYIEALLTINDEYQYNNYFLSREACVQILSDMCSSRRYAFMREDNETEEDEETALPGRILNWLVRTKWLRKIEDYEAMTTNIVIPDYAAVMIEAFEKLADEPLDDTDLYIQNVYATLFSFKNDHRMNLTMLKTALVNTKKLNKALQDMLHNMNKFFAKLLQQDSYSGILREHLDSYVEEIVWKKYHILKTSDNFYIYKMDIKKCLREIRDDEAFIMKVQVRSKMLGDNQDDVLDLLDLIERGFDDIEHRIANMDKEHTKYVRATVTRMNYLLSGETDTKGLVVQLLNKMSEDPDQMEEIITETGKRMNLSLLEILSEKSLYKRRKSRKDFISQLLPDETTGDLDKDDILRLNRIQMRFSKKQIEEFIENNMEDEVMDASKINIADEEEFEKLILAYDYSTRKNSRYMVLEEEPEMVEKDGYRYPALRFVKRRA